MTRPLTLVEKIATAHAVGPRPGQAARPGDIITIRPARVMTHDNTSAVISKFEAIGATAIHDPRQPVFAIDHDIQNRTPVNLAKYAAIEAFARRHGIDFYPAGSGISHQVMVEQGYVTPGSLVVASDFIINGGIASLGEARQHLLHVDGVMLGRAAYQEPWRLLAADPELFGETAPHATMKDVLEAVTPYIEDQLAQGTRLHSITRHFVGAFHGVPGARAFRRHLAENGVRPGAGVNVLRDAIALVEDRVVAPLAA